MPDGSTRIQLEFSDKMIKTIDRCKRQSGAESRAEVLRRAISIYSALLQASKDGEAVTVGNKTLIV